MKSPIRFATFTFYPEGGELVEQEGSGQERSTRLAPQPAKLLHLLLERYPEMVSQEDIRKALWPEVQVDYERSLHYCIRQVRAALGDDAARPRFIETIPRRGYRWIAAFEQGQTPPAPSRRFSFKAGRIFALGVVAVALLFTFMLLLQSGSVTGPEKPVPLRVGILPFQAPESTHPFAGNDIALRLVETLTNAQEEPLEVIGPTTTVRYPPEQLPALIRDFDLHYLINGRFSLKDRPRGMLAEIIRAEDGAHVWVRYFEADTPADSIVGLISAGLSEQWRRPAKLAPSGD